MSARDTKEEQDYTPQDVVNQSLVAFGQGTQFMRVSSRACRCLVEVMGSIASQRALDERWGQIAVQLLERIRLVGRVAASRATEEARTYINDEDVEIALRRVRVSSKSGDCDETGSDDDGKKGTATSASYP